MYYFVLFVFIFSMGAIFGYGLEVLYRHFADKEKRWFNPGFCVGPWLPIYGIGLLSVFLLSFLEAALPIENAIIKKIILFTIMALLMTLIELIAGELLLKFYNTRLWDYSDEKFNYKGFICLKFSIFWMLLSAGYYFIIHPLIFDATVWLSKNIIFSFFIGAFLGVFVIDVIYSGNVLNKIKNYAKEKGVITKFEDLKESIRKKKSLIEAKQTFFVLMLKERFEDLTVSR